MSVSPISIHLPPGSRADMSDESLMVGVGRSPLVVQLFHSSRYDVTPGGVT